MLYWGVPSLSQLDFFGSWFKTQVDIGGIIEHTILLQQKMERERTPQKSVFANNVL